MLPRTAGHAMRPTGPPFSAARAKRQAASLVALTVCVARSCQQTTDPSLALTAWEGGAGAAFLRGGGAAGRSGRRRGFAREDGVEAGLVEDGGAELLGFGELR